MQGRHSAVDLPAKSDRLYHTEMIQLAREQTEKIRRQMKSPVEIAESKDEGKTELERKIKNREAPCPTCKSRKYRDKSDDSGVSFQSAKHIPVSGGGVQIMRHESEHVSRNRTEPGTAKEGEIRTCNVQLLHDTCPTCGRSYVSGGLTFTHSHAAGEQAMELEQSEIARQRVEVAGEEIDIEA